MIWIAVVITVCVGLLLVFCISRRSKNKIIEDGGIKNDTSYDAPKTINSTKITSFWCDFSTLNNSNEDIRIARCVYKLKAVLKDGEVIGSYVAYNQKDSKKYSFVVDANFMDELQKIVAKHNLAQHNGLSYHVYGLPDGYGAYLSVDYESKERIYASNNQSNFLSIKAMEELEQLFSMQSQDTESDSSNAT